MCFAPSIFTRPSNAPQRSGGFFPTLTAVVFPTLQAHKKRLFVFPTPRTQKSLFLLACLPFPKNNRLPRLKPPQSYIYIIGSYSSSPAGSLRLESYNWHLCKIAPLQRSRPKIGASQEFAFLNYLFKNLHKILV